MQLPISIYIQSKLSLWTPLYYRQFVWSKKCQKSYIPYLYNTDTSVKWILGSVRLVSVLKSFHCAIIFIKSQVLLRFRLLPEWVSTDMHLFTLKNQILYRVIDSEWQNIWLLQCKLLSGLWQINWLSNSVWWCSRWKKASPDYKNIAVYAWSPNWIFRMGFSSPQVWSKILNFFFACIWAK